MMTMITDRIGIGDYTDGLQLPPAVDASLNVAIEVDIPLRGGDAAKHKVGLIDGPGNDAGTVLAAVILLNSLNKRYRRVLVHCSDGNARSIPVVAAYVAGSRDMEYKQVFNDIMKARGATDFRMPLYQQIEQMLPLIKKTISSI